MSRVVGGWDGVEILMTRRFVVVGVMPKRRKDSAICFEGQDKSVAEKQMDN